jgi:hypothetical protein
MFVRAFLILFSATSYAQSFNSFIWNAADPSAYNSKDLFRFEDSREWPKLREDLKVTLKLGASIYSNPEYADNPESMSWWPPTRWQQECETAADQPPVTGKLLHVTSRFAIVQVDSSNSLCGERFNSNHSNRRVVFVPKEAVATIVPRKYDGEEKTEAAIIEKGACEICKVAGADADLRAFVKAAKATYTSNRPMKTAEEQERYFQCYKTPYQDNYDRFYKKLFDDAAKIFVVSVKTEKSVDRKTKKVAKKTVIKPIDFSDFESTESTRPQDALVIVRTDANLMKCVGLRESSWNPSDVSETGAMGIGQQTQENIDHIKCMLKGCTAYRDKYAKGKPVLDSNGKPVQEPYFRQPDKWAATIWRRFFDHEKKRFSAEDWKRLTTNPRTGAPCTETMEIKERDAPCPINSIAGLALYHIVAELQMRRASNLHKGENDGTDFNMEGEEALSFRLTQGTTTNGGVGTTRKTIELFQNPIEWVKRIGNVSKRPGEVGDYAKFLRNCYANGSWKPYFTPPEYTTKAQNGSDGKRRMVKAPWENPNCFTPEISQSVDRVMGVK